MKKNVLVVFGGRSAEHDVSIITAHTPIMNTLQIMDDCEAWPCYIDKQGSWFVDKRLNDIEFYRQAGYQDRLTKEFKRAQLLFNSGLEIVWPGLKSRSVKIDVVFPAMHGTYGEDGSLMGLMRMAGVPFVGCDMGASVLALDKVFTKQIAEANKLPVVPYVWHDKKAWRIDRQSVLKSATPLGYPLFIKPVHLGSSIGITMVKNIKQLEHGLEVGFHYDDKVLVEKNVENLIEVTLPIMGNDELTCALVEQPLQKSEFFDFETKYLGQGKKHSGANTGYSKLPANIDKHLYSQVEVMGQDLYRIMGMSGIARVDFLIDGKTNQIYINEVNTLPGSLYCHNWKQAGVSNVELLGRLIKLAFERFESNKEINYTFISSILQPTGAGNNLESQN